MEFKDELQGQIFICMDCSGVFTIEQGTFPQYSSEGEMIMDENNNRTREEFVCYDCCE